jgi:Tfp pilus assembly protein PilX
VNAARPHRLVVLALVTVLGLSACASTPSSKRIAQDVVDRMVVQGQISDAAGRCMQERIDEYSQDDLQDIAESADAGNTDGVADLARFERDLAACTS